MSQTTMTPAPIKPTIPIDILNQIDVRAGTIESVSDVAGSDKLVALRVNFGDHSRTIVAGLKQERANPSEIEGRQALFVSTWSRARCEAWFQKACSSTSAIRMASGPCWQCPSRPFPTAAARGKGAAAACHDKRRGR